MSSYFDNAQKEVRDCFEDIEDIEDRVKHEVLLVSGDRETPEQIRGDLMGIIATYQYTPNYDKEFPELPITKGRKLSDLLKQSQMVEELHSYFHEIARMGIKTRFGGLSDNPSRILSARDSYIKETFK